jgi:copper transport protein
MSMHGTVRRAVVLLAAVVVLALGQLIGAGPAAAHAELVDSTPENGARLNQAPDQVALEFTESIGLIDEGIRLLDADGQAVETPDPIADGSTVRWEMPVDLPDGAYLVNWRVLSGDSHPVAGAFSFGVGDDVTVEPVVADAPAAFDAPWPVIVARFGGYLGFTVLTGAIVFALACWKPARDHSRTQTLLRTGFVVALLSTILGLLLQGPYAAGQPLTRLFDRALVSEATNSVFGAWTQIRVYVLLAMSGVLWPRGAMETRLNQWIAGGGVVALAVTFSGTSHAAASGSFTERVMDSTHVLTAGIWAGGLLAFTWTATTRGEKPGTRAFAAFSSIALVAVLVLITTGTINSLYRLDTVDALWDTDYGQVLSLKFVLFAAALGFAGISRRRLHHDTEPWRTVRLEAATIVAVLAATAVLASLSPPATNRGTTVEEQPQAVTVDLDLGSGKSAQVQVDPPTTGGSAVAITLLDSRGEPVDARRAELRASLSGEDLGPLNIDLIRKQAGTWGADFTFPLPGAWTLTLTVEDQQQAAVVTTGEVEIS